MDYSFGERFRRRLDKTTTGFLGPPSSRLDLIGLAEPVAAVSQRIGARAPGATHADVDPAAARIKAFGGTLLSGTKSTTGCTRSIASGKQPEFETVAVVD